MVFSYYLYTIPYTIFYKILKIFRKPLPVVFYCPYMLDWYIFEPIQKYLKKFPVVTNDPNIRTFFREKNYKVFRLPVFPKAVIMCRHSCHRFPSTEIIKIGCNHHAYHFKKLTKAENYNLFDLYLLNSKSNLSAAEKIGVKCGKAIGFPKLDSAFNGDISCGYLKKLREKIGINNKKKTLLFTSTWIESGMSAFFRWQKRLHELTDSYNIIVTLHPWISEVNRQSILSVKDVHLISNEYTLPYIMISDYCIGDNSTILCECCALNKPIITFRTQNAKRSLKETDDILNKISIRIDNFEEIRTALEEYEKNPYYKQEERAQANKIMFDKLDGKAGLRAAEEIIKLVPELKI